jgi:hypothetical protein
LRVRFLGVIATRDHSLPGDGGPASLYERLQPTPPRRVAAPVEEVALETPWRARFQRFFARDGA